MAPKKNDAKEEQEKNDTVLKMALATITSMEKRCANARAEIAKLTKGQTWQSKILALMKGTKSELAALEEYTGPKPLRFSDSKTMDHFMRSTDYKTGTLTINMGGINTWIERYGVDQDTVEMVRAGLARRGLFWLTLKEAVRRVDVSIILEGVAQAAHIRTALPDGTRSLRPPLMICPEFWLPAGLDPVVIQGRPLPKDATVPEYTPRGLCDFMIVKATPALLDHIATMSTGRGEFVSRVGEEEVDVCIVEAKRTSELDGGLAQAALQGVTLGKEADRSLRIQNVIVADGDNWFFAIVDPVNKIARFSPAVILNQHINIRQLIALITIWVDRSDGEAQKSCYS